MKHLVSRFFTIALLFSIATLFAGTSASAYQAHQPDKNSYSDNGFTLIQNNALAVASGGSHTCALTTTGGVMCWGDNTYGQLGDGTTTRHITPVAVVGLSSGVTALAAGDDHTCALTTSGGVECWGWNIFGQLGDGTTTDRSTPVNVVGLSSGVTALTAGYGHTCALTASGGAQCWGSNLYGQLGDGTTEDRSMPVDVVDLSTDVTSLAAGGYHTCGSSTSGKVKCWGWNVYGQLGDSTLTEHHTPVDVVGLSNHVTALAAGDFYTCALTASGGAVCWGSNGSGQLGNAGYSDPSTPVDVLGLPSDIKALAAGGSSTCALTTTGGAICWGSAGQLGDGSPWDSNMPKVVAGFMNGVAALSVGGDHTCAVTIAGGIKCWGANDSGQIGDGTTTNSSIPVDVAGLFSGVVTLASGYDHTCALTNSGGVECWGSDEYRQLGDGDTLDRSTPIEVKGLSGNVVALTAGYYHNCVITAAGGVKCWGWDDYGQLGDGNWVSGPIVDVVGLSSGVRSLAAGLRHTCALTTSGGVKCWGDNTADQLGDGTNINRLTPVDVVGLSSGVAALVAGGAHNCVLTSQGGVKCWGANDSGQLGDGTHDYHNTPVDVVSLSSGVQAIAAGGSHTCALLISGGAKCWGDNNSGQLGDGTTTEYDTLVDVKGLSGGEVAIGGGALHTCALTSAGGVECWGDNNDGQLGDGTTTAHFTPMKVVGLTGSVVELSVGGYHTCVVTASGSAKCWGGNFSGQLGYKILGVPANVIGFEGGFPGNRFYLPVFAWR
jgi:alpha-tubulin suppressor-like RCC1 family protein